MRNIRILIVAFCALLFVVSCAKRGTITGGDKDTKPPKITSSLPENFSTNFNKKMIKITFDEYVKIKDLQKQLIVSPPMKTPITVLPQGSASKYITIKINDTLKPNTTYSFNFGKSIVDYNEGNPYPQLKYVLSTGTYIDSLFIEGIIKDSYEKNTDKSVNVMLYEVDEKYTDSIIYKQTPRYITNTSDSLKSFKIENIKAGKYKLVALKEKSDNYKFDPNKDKIGFYNQIISVPDKSLFELELFKEEAKFKAKKPSQTSSNRIIIGYEGSAKNIKIEAKQNGKVIKTRLTKFEGKDSVQAWFAPIKNDSIQLNIENGQYKKDYIVKLKNQRQDSLNLSPKQTGVITFKENITITTKTPLDKFDLTKMILTRKDSSKVDFKTNYDEYNQIFEVLFTKEPEEKYTFSLLPNAVEDYLGHKNDSLTFKFSTKNTSDYGNLKINLKNVKSFPVIVELTDKNGKIFATEYSENNPTIEFILVEPQKYSLRVIYDQNNNKQRDTGSYLDNIQPEEVVHYPTEIDIRANWDVNQDFDLGK
ncbi:Ig-like domain-containing protein [Flavobacterium sp.]|uniref:Ig-like domain-containing protein n=1 Tax=Flavobacterium sp. TaxID=239 RepID=UPI003753A4A6